MKVLIFPMLFALSVANATSVAEVNMASTPPVLDQKAGACKIQLGFKPAIAPPMDEKHGYIVVTKPNGSKLEIRGGPSHKGSGTSSELGPVGNPFSCAADNKWGVVVPYIGPHGVIGKDLKGANVYSPDGNVSNSFTSIEKTADSKSTCAIANCLMTVVSAAGKMCKPYTIGTGKLRNSNTIISFALASCGVSDPLPAGVKAAGWGSSWEN